MSPILALLVAWLAFNAGFVVGAWWAGGRRMKRFDDGHRPHQWPGNPPDGDPEVIAWRCAACGRWISDYGDIPEDCPVDWRNGERRTNKKYPHEAE